jgi:hypothetical protein
MEEYSLKTRATINERIAERAVDLIRRGAASEQSFSTYVSFTHIHPPYGVHAGFVGRSGGGEHSDMLTEMDYRSGQILDELEDACIFLQFALEHLLRSLTRLDTASQKPTLGVVQTPTDEQHLFCRHRRKRVDTSRCNVSMPNPGQCDLPSLGRQLVHVRGHRDNISLAA